VPGRSTQSEQTAVLIGVAIVLFVVTNLDDVFLLIVIGMLVIIEARTYELLTQPV
jgi:1,4-dihydroxy-2-naphthoate octaprenyltransferase